jgi:hypothetical protein
MDDYLKMRHLTGRKVYLDISGGKFELRERVPAHEPGDQKIFLVVCVGMEGIVVTPAYKPPEAGHVHDRFLRFHLIT